MPSYEHKTFLERIARIDQVPDDDFSYQKWLKANQHLVFIEENALESEIVIYASSEYTFIHSLLVPNNLLSSPDQADLLQWSCNPYTSAASYVHGGGRKNIWIEHGPSGVGSNTLAGGKHLVFGRTFEGWTGEDKTYFELNQEIVHLLELHWRPEHKAYCKYDNSGDLDQVFSITKRGTDGKGISLVTCRWEPLEEYLAISDYSLVRMFDFTLLRPGNFAAWPAGPEDKITRTSNFFFRRKEGGDASYTRGVQIIRIRQNAQRIMDEIKDRWSGKPKSKKYVEFIAQDWRNRQIRPISTQPGATTNYFEAGSNDLPFELSPAFFKPEVLLKYKADKDKYEVGDREITCRSAWYLRGFDVNEAGQIHAYICDLRQLPYNEQLHWLSYNVEPQAPISKRAYTTDFEGEFVSNIHPLRSLISTLERWRATNVLWWTLRDTSLPQRTSVPMTSSQDEWAESFMDLSKLIVEGFNTKAIRKKISECSIEADASAQSIALLEKLAKHYGLIPASKQGLDGLRIIQNIRSKVKGHSGSSEAKEIVRSAIEQHENFSGHFKHVCSLVEEELEIIENIFNKLIRPQDTLNK